MVEETLVRDWIEAGRVLTENLDQEGFHAVASFWLYESETRQWRLLLASPLVDQEGPTWAYEKIQKLLRSKPELKLLSLDDISVVSPNYDLVKLLRVAVRTGKGVSGIRFTRNRINDQFVEDAYIYRLT